MKMSFKTSNNDNIKFMLELPFLGFSNGVVPGTKRLIFIGYRPCMGKYDDRGLRQPVHVTYQQLIIKK
jgi:hypothetical protein